MNLWSGGGWSLTSWRTPTTPRRGNSGTRWSGEGLLPEIVMLDSSDAIKYRTGVWNGRWFSGIPEMNSYSNMFVFHVTVSQSEVSFSYAANAGAPPSLSRVLLNYTAEAVRVVWVPDKRGWANFFTGPREDCDHYNRCGHSGVCNQTAASTAWPCSCVQGFVPVSSSDWDGRDPSGGCRRNVSLDCGDNGTTDGFVRLPGVKLPDTLNSSLDTSITLDECRARCLANCSCVAYAAADVQGGGDDVGTGCIMWPENLTDLRYVAGGQTLYLRQATPPSGRNLLIQMTEAVETAQDPSVSSIALATVKSATRNFSTRNVIGEGTFGIVYEGKLPRGHPLLHGLAGRTIAVKRLKPIGDLPDIIVRYFTREMQLMSGLKQHRNVLRLLAYCDEASERILVYEYMHRRSLDAYIFGTPRERALLNWCRRLQIIQGIADGVKHLHEGEGSAGNVIHRDLKPANVLLDGGWQAKVADFGTAKLLVAGATGTRTRIGTP
ncbi:Receptor-like serine/threonine-protein kinase SD1-8 [Zea mays]|uniref:non-specific serine/threonine protein kinase n=1 Tax=Zea mays TaxID=4577 RepID=A0A1D6DXM4_MAIZE|nr:Receptor-like serine/threonine-protein kinase SD1-8 [Zea mays]